MLGLRRARKKLNMTQQELAERIGKGRKTIGRWEKGDSGPKWSDIQKLAKALDVSVRTLFDNE